MLGKVEKRRLRGLEARGLELMLLGDWRRLHALTGEELELLKAGVSDLDREIIETMMQCSEDEISRAAVSFDRWRRGI